MLPLESGGQERFTAQVVKVRTTKLKRKRYHLRLDEDDSEIKTHLATRQWGKDKNNLGMDLQKAPVLRAERYLEMRPTIDRDSTALLKGLLSCTVEKNIGNAASGVSAIRFGNGYTLSNVTLRPDTLYARDFYPDLLRTVRSFHRSILLSNSGTGKSMFQFYYLARILNPAAFPNESLPPDFLGSIEPPKAVIRQIGQSKMTVFFPQEQVAHKVPCSADVFDCFDPKTTICLYEPGRSSEEPFWDTTTLPILATVSPMLSRYKEFKKNGGKTVYMPLFTRSELLDIGCDMREMPGGLPTRVTDIGISDRFKEFGGIIRHVLSDDADDIEEARKQRVQAINKLDCSKLLSAENSTLEDPDVSHLIFSYDVNKINDRKFRNMRIKFVSEGVRLSVVDALDKADLNELIGILETVDRVKESYLKGSAPKIFEKVVRMHLTSPTGVKWRTYKNKVRGAEFNIKLKQDCLLVQVNFFALEENQLVHPTQSNFPHGDMYFKIIDGYLIIIQNGYGKSKSAMIRTIKYTAFIAFLAQLGLPPDFNKIKYYYCPHPSKAAECSVVFDKDFPADYEKFSVQVLAIPETYRGAF